MQKTIVVTDDGFADERSFIDPDGMKDSGEARSAKRDVAEYVRACLAS